VVPSSAYGSCFFFSLVSLGMTFIFFICVSEFLVRSCISVALRSFFFSLFVCMSFWFDLVPQLLWDHFRFRVCILQFFVCCLLLLCIEYVLLSFLLRLRYRFIRLGFRFLNLIKYDISSLCFDVWVFGLFYSFAIVFMYFISCMCFLKFERWCSVLAFSKFYQVCILVLCFEYLFVFLTWLFVVYFYCLCFIFFFTSSNLCLLSWNGEDIWYDQIY